MISNIDLKSLSRNIQNEMLRVLSADGNRDDFIFIFKTVFLIFYYSQYYVLDFHSLWKTCF